MPRKDKLKEQKKKKCPEKTNKNIHYRRSEFECTVCERKFSKKRNLQAQKKVCCKCRHCREQISSQSQVQNHVCREKITTELAAKQFKPDEPLFQTKNLNNGFPNLTAQ